MRIILQLFAFTFTAILVGCTTNSPRKFPGGRLDRNNLPSTVILLPHDIEFKAKPNWGMARTYVLPAGEYHYHGKDGNGYFLKHAGKGFRYGAMGSSPGGFFMPFDDAKPWGLWGIGASVSQAMAVLGPIGAAVGSADPESEANYVVDLPQGVATELAAYVRNPK